MSTPDVRLQSNTPISAPERTENKPQGKNVPVGKGKGASDVNALSEVLQKSVNTIKEKVPALNLSDKQCLQLFANFGYDLKTLESDENARKAAEEKVLKTIHYVSSKYIDKLPNKKLTFEALNEYTIKYNIQLKSGWDSIDSFEKRQYDGNRTSLTERLKNFGFSEEQLKNPETRKECLIKYFRDYFGKLKEQEGVNGKNIAKKQLTDFSKLMFNSSPDERVEMVEAIEYLLAENRCPAFKGLLESMMDIAGKQRVANAATVEKQENWFRKTDALGNSMSEEDAREISAEASKYQSEDAIRDNLEKANNKAKELFTPENQKRYEELKKQDFEKLSEEDKKFIKEYEFQAIFRSGQIAGTAQNETIDDVTALLKDLNKAAYDNAQPVYRDILNKINDYIKKHPELGKEFENYINKITGGNYDIAVNDRKNGTTTDFNTPNASEDSAISVDGGYKLSDKSVLFSAQEYLNNFKFDTTEDEPETFTIEKKKDEPVSSSAKQTSNPMVLKAKAYAAQSFDEINQYLKALNMSTHEYVKGVLTDNKPVSKVAEMYASMKTQSASFAFKNVLCTFAENNKTLADNLRKITGMDALLRKHGVEESV